MSDAKKQSIERCKYNHQWQARCEESNIVAYRCSVCNYEPKRDSKLWEEAAAIIHLRTVLSPGDTVYTVLRHVSRSGMSRNIDLYYMAQDDKGTCAPQWISAYVGHAIGSPQSYKNWQHSQGLTVGGCGMDMGFHLVYELSMTLFRDGFTCPGETCPSNDHSNDRSEAMLRKNFKGQRHTGDGGYALRHSWL